MTRNHNYPDVHDDLSYLAGTENGFLKKCYSDLKHEMCQISISLTVNVAYYVELLDIVESISVHHRHELLLHLRS